ncbi:MAG: S-layer homology domain-containing protein [Oscillospiraceae bacterium]|nr:S-layer homology domain-containing protein [Oscillospiraceae bacterium]
MNSKKWCVGHANAVISTAVTVLAAIAMVFAMSQSASAAGELTVGTGKDYATLAAAALDVVDGDTIVLTEDVIEVVSFTGFSGALTIKSEDSAQPSTITGNLTFDDDVDLTIEDVNIETSAGAGISFSGPDTSTLTVLGACEVTTSGNGIYAVNDLELTLDAAAALSIETTGGYAHGISSNIGDIYIDTGKNAVIDIHTGGGYSNGIFTTQAGFSYGNSNIDVNLGENAQMNIAIDSKDSHGIFSWHDLSIALDDGAEMEIATYGDSNSNGIAAKYNNGNADITLGENAKLSVVTVGTIGADTTYASHAIYSDSDMTIALDEGAQLFAATSGQYSYGIYSKDSAVEISMEDNAVLDAQASGSDSYGIAGNTMTLSGTPAFLYAMGGTQAMNVAPDDSALEGKQHGTDATSIFAVVCTPRIVDVNQPPITTAAEHVYLDLSRLLQFDYPYDNLTFTFEYSTDGGITWSDTGIPLDSIGQSGTVDVADLLTAAGTYQFRVIQMVTYGGEDYDSYEDMAELTVIDAYTVTYDANGGNGSSYEETGILEGSYTLLSDLDVGFTANGDYYFSGWKDAEGTLYNAGDSITVDKDLTLYAQWTANGSTPEPVTYYQVTYHENGADAGTVPVDANQYRAGDTVTTLYNTGSLRLSGYYFTGWSLDPSGGTVLRPGAEFVINDADVDLYAIWQVTTSSKATGGSSSSASSELESLYDEEVPLAALTTEHIWYIQGYPDNSVRPDGNLTRAEAAAIFYRLIDDSSKTQTTYTASFLDVSTSDWYDHEIAYLANRGVMFGYADDTFRGNDEITRAEFAALASRFSALVLVDGNNFSDVGDDHWAVAYINSAVASGWISGYADGTFRPDQSITRAEAVTLVNHVLERALLAGNEPEDLHSYSDLTTAHWAYYDIMEASHTHDYDLNDNGEEIWTEFS